MTNKDLIKQYVDTGVGIPRYQFDKLSNQDKKTYLRKIYISLIYEPWKIEFYHGELSDENKLKIVQQNDEAIEYIEDPNEDIQMAAVEQNPWLIEYIENPTEDVQMYSIKKNGGVLKYIKKPTYDVLDYFRIHHYYDIHKYSHYYNEY
jgi:hypothetical protein